MTDIKKIGIDWHPGYTKPVNPTPSLPIRYKKSSDTGWWIVLAILIIAAVSAFAPHMLMAIGRAAL